MHHRGHTKIYLNWNKRSFPACVAEYTICTEGSTNVLVCAVAVNVLKFEISVVKTGTCQRIIKSDENRLFQCKPSANLKQFQQLTVTWTPNAELNLRKLNI